MKERFARRALAVSLSNPSKGFTLIELLVVIAIIGLLAAVVLASVGSARNKGVDAAVKGQLSSARAAAELFASDNGNSYDGVCGTGAGAFGTPNGVLYGAQNPTGATFVGVDTAQTAGTVACYDEDTAWAFSAPVSATTGGYWCVDSTGASKAEVAANLLTASVCD